MVALKQMVVQKIVVGQSTSQWQFQASVHGMLPHPTKALNYTVPSGKLILGCGPWT